MDRNPWGTQNYIPSRTATRWHIFGCRPFQQMAKSSRTTYPWSQEHKKSAYNIFCVGRNSKQHTNKILLCRAVCTISVCVQTLLPWQVFLDHTGLQDANGYHTLSFMYSWQLTTILQYLPMDWIVPDTRLYPTLVYGIWSADLQCCGSRIFIPDPGSDFFASRIRIFCIRNRIKEFKYGI